MAVEDLMKEVVTQLEKMITTRTIVGEPITAAGKTVIPISKVSFGFGSGGGEGKRGEEGGFGGGGGGGAKIEPVAFLVISEEEVKLVGMKGKGLDIEKIIESVPELVEKVKSLKGAKKNKPEESADED
ncbi:MAG: sporulation protein [ANME-2 cluster archaeon]|jgi:sporulation protein YtfJ|nr:MAG: sporulation protein [ANME-2 cluster archaeon]NOQ28753.1 sporulation protein [Methanosarcinales archaeon]